LFLCTKKAEEEKLVTFIGQEEVLTRAQSKPLRMSPSTEKNNPRVGVGVIVYSMKTRRILIGKRKGSHGSGQLALPGGALDFGEKSIECALRELSEETGIRLNDDAEKAQEPYFSMCESIIDENNHWVTIFHLFVVEYELEAKVMEPEKCEYWKWTCPYELYRVQDEGDRAMFLPLEKLLNSKDWIRKLLEFEQVREDIDIDPYHTL